MGTLAEWCDANDINLHQLKYWMIQAIASSKVQVRQAIIEVKPDLRKSIDGLAAIVQLEFDMDLFYPNIFIFCNCKRDKLKLLYWDYNRFWLYYRRLEKGGFQ